ncbi:phospholipase-like protein, partial [Tanacetum coccineum]
MSSTVELSKPYDCQVTIRSRPSTISFIKEMLTKSNKRLKLFKDTIFGKYLDLDVEDNDNHLLNYVLHHQRPQLSKSIDSNIVFDIAGHTLLFGRSEFCLVTGFACGKLVFPEYMDDAIPPFLRRVFPDKVKKQENKASLGKVVQGKAAK